MSDKLHQIPKSNAVPSAPTVQELYGDMMSDSHVVYSDAPPTYTPLDPNARTASTSGGTTNLFSDPHSMMLEPARNLIQKSKFEEAIEILEKLPPSITQQLMLAESYIELGRNINATKRIIELEKMMTSPTRPKLGDVNKVIDSYIENGQYVRALIFLLCSSKLYKIELNPANIVRTLHSRCSIKCYNIIIAMKKENKDRIQIAKDFGIEIMLEILHELQSVNVADKNMKLNQEAYILNCIAAAYGGIGLYKDEIKYCEKGIDFMKTSFGANAQRYRIYGHLWNNKAIANALDGNHIEAEKNYLQSLDYYEKAEDWVNKEQKEKTMGGVEKRLQTERDLIKRIEQNNLAK